MAMGDSNVSDSEINKHLEDKYGFNREEKLHIHQMVTARYMDEEELCDPDRAFVFNVRHLKKALNDAIASGDMRGRTAIMKQLSVITGSNKTGSASGDESFSDIMDAVMIEQDSDDDDEGGFSGGFELTSGAYVDLPEN